MTQPPYGVYVHVPFCASRCGYCDFNTYTPAELRSDGAGSGTDTGSYVAAVLSELRLAADDPRSAGASDGVATVFFGGGTPSLLAGNQIGDIVAAIGRTWGLRGGAEVTLEANPDTVTPEAAAQWRDAGVTRVSLGMQSSVPSVLATLDRTHQADAPAYAAEVLRASGMEFSLDLIYGTPGETVEQWQHSVQTAVALQPGHVSAYALTVEPGTALYRKVQRGNVTGVDGDDQATKYELVEDLLAGAGYEWYEISNWTRSDAQRCRHNEGYWAGGQWWGLGPGAHSYGVGAGGENIRWWNAKHPARYAALVGDGQLPEQDRETLTPEQETLERVLLGIRLRDGLSVTNVPLRRRGVIQELAEDGLIVLSGGEDPGAGVPQPGAEDAAAGRIVLTRRGRLLCDRVVHALTA